MKDPPDFGPGGFFRWPAFLKFGAVNLGSEHFLRQDPRRKLWFRYFQKKGSDPKFQARQAPQPFAAFPVPTASAGTSIQSPGINGWVASENGPILVRTRRRVGSPTAAVMRRTWRFFPSSSVMAIQLVGLSWRTRIGGLRGHSHSGSAIGTARQG